MRDESSLSKTESIRSKKKPRSREAHLRLVLLIVLMLSLAASAEPVHTKELRSPELFIDRIYKSMQGPAAQQSFKLLDQERRELLWIVGYEAVVVDPSSGRAISQEYLCHSNLDYNPEEYAHTVGTKLPLDGRFFTLSQGQQRVQFLEGFGIPVYSDEEFTLGTQVLNLNQPKLKKNVTYRIKVDFIKDSETTRPYRALQQLGIYGMKRVGSDESCRSKHGTSCAVGKAAMEGAEMNFGGEKLTGHWIVEPGREVNRTDVTQLLRLNEPIRVHYIAVHLHPFAESLALVDEVSGKTLFKANVRSSKGRVGIDHIDHYSSAEGFRLEPFRKYSLVSVYNNTSEVDVDSMAVMYLYSGVRGFSK